MVNFSFYFFVSIIVFFIGLLGLILNRRHLLLLLFSFELMLLSINLNFVFFSVFLDDILGQIFSLFILTIAAVESSIGLALLTVYFKDKQTIFLENFIISRG